VTGASQTKKAIVTFTVAANAAPSCSITSPSGGFSYTAPATINITASASDIGGYVTSVEFYNNGILLGTDSNGADGWTYSWTNVEASGSNGIVLTAKAYDNLNAVTTSSSVTGTVTDSALKGYWKLDSSSGTSATDSSGTGNTGTTYNSPTWGACKVLNGLTYNGSNQYAQKTSAVSLPTAGANQTLSCWIYVSSAPTVRKTAMCMTGSSSGNYIGYLNSTTFGVWRYGGTAIVTTTSLPTTGAWHHVAYVKNGSNKYLYIDGSQAATSTATTNTASSTTINAGRTTSGADYWPGKVDEVRIYNRVLTLTEIQSLAAGKQ
jgi:hypothetical protein